jgi:hypothetical protein
MSKFLRRVAISPEVEQTFDKFESLVGNLNEAVKRGENFGYVYDRLDMPYQSMQIRNNHQRLIESFIEDFPKHAALLRYTPFFDRMANAGSRRVWLCYQAARSNPEPNLAFVERIRDILNS